ncbi:MAG: phage holin family protein [Solirubrobacteraceae bacterium]
MPAENGQPDNIATAITDVSDRVTRLVHDEIELAKAEVAEKAKSLATGGAMFAAGAVFGVFAFIFILVTAALAIDAAFTTGLDELWIGFAVVLVILLMLTMASVMIARRFVSVGAPAPTMAIDEARKIRETIAGTGVEL